MPLYEYRCKSCGNAEEFRTSMDKKQEMVSSLICNSCGSTDFQQVFSGIALTQSSGSSAVPPSSSGGCCSGGMCNL